MGFFKRWVIDFDLDFLFGVCLINFNNVEMYNNEDYIINVKC